MFLKEFPFEYKGRFIDLPDMAFGIIDLIDFMDIEPECVFTKFEEDLAKIEEELENEECNFVIINWEKVATIRVDEEITQEILRRVESFVQRLIAKLVIKDAYIVFTNPELAKVIY